MTVDSNVWVSIGCVAKQRFNCPLYLQQVAVLLVVLCALAYADNSSDCPLPELLSGVPSCNVPLLSLCNPSHEPGGTCTVHIEGGSVTYNGNSSGSIAFYNASAAYCLNSNSSRECVGGMWTNYVMLEKVATENILEGWNIALIAIGAVAFVVGDAIVAALGTWLAVKTVQVPDRAVAIAMIVVSVVIVLPVAGPIALIMYVAFRKLGHDAKTIEMKSWYRVLTAFTILLKLLEVVLWVVHAGYIATHDFYGKGPLRDKSGMCVPHQPNTEQNRVQNILVIIVHVISVMDIVYLHIHDKLFKWGTKKSKDSADLGSKIEEIKDNKETHELHPVDNSPSPHVI